jgi:hypothetical protein
MKVRILSFLIRFTVKRILKVRKNMLHFIIGVFVGSFVGVFFMCLIQAGRDYRDDE